MADQAEVKHYKIVDEHSTPDNPAGVLHRETRDGQINDSAYSFRIGDWNRDTTMYLDAAVNPADGPGLVEITAGKAQQLIQVAKEHDRSQDSGL